MKYSKRMSSYIQTHGREQVRDGRNVVEVTNFSDHIMFSDIELVDVPSSFNCYNEINLANLHEDLYTRRAFTNFSNKDPCLSSISIQYIEDYIYIVTVVFRSSDVNKIDGDLSFIKNRIRKCNLKGECINVQLYFINAHYYS